MARDNAYHQAALARRAELFEQEFEQRRLMLGLHRFHEFEMMNIRKAGAAESNRTIHPEREPGDLASSVVKPKPTLFKQVLEDGSEIAEPLYLKVVWVDSDRGGLFKWTSGKFERDEEKPFREKSQA